MLGPGFIAHAIFTEMSIALPLQQLHEYELYMNMSKKKTMTNVTKRTFVYQ